MLARICLPLRESSLFRWGIRLISSRVVNRSCVYYTELDRRVTFPIGALGWSNCLVFGDRFDSSGGDVQSCNSSLKYFKRYKGLVEGDFVTALINSNLRLSIAV